MSVKNVKVMRTVNFKNMNYLISRSSKLLLCKLNFYNAYKMFTSILELLMKEESDANINTAAPSWVKTNS